MRNIDERGKRVDGTNKVTSQDVCGPYNLGKTFDPKSGIESNGLWRDVKELLMLIGSVPVTPHMATLNSRMKTYEKWPIPQIQFPKRLAEAGFYYIFEGDNVLCFHCGGGLKNWEVEDDPWVDHAKHFSKCGFVLKEKGMVFVIEVLRRESEEMSGEMRMQRPKLVNEEKGGIRGSNEKQKKRKNKLKKNIVLISGSLSNYELENQLLISSVTEEFSNHKRRGNVSEYFCGVKNSWGEQRDDQDEERERLTRRCSIVNNDEEGEGGKQKVTRVTEHDQEDEEEEEVEEQKGSRGVEHGQEVEESTLRPQDPCEPCSLKIRPFSGPERSFDTKSGIESNGRWRDIEELLVSIGSVPVTPHMATLNSRMKTYEKWPIPQIQFPKRLAEAGFYYIFEGDNVLCFHCGGGLKNWEVEDDPWVDHAKHFSKCGFVLKEKGMVFVIEVLRRESEEMSEEMRMQTVDIVREENLESRKNGEKTMNTKMENKITSFSRETSSSKGETQALHSSESAPEKIELCRVCYAKERVMVFLPCGHFVCCSECALSLNTCAVCRKPFEASVRAYLS